VLAAAAACPHPPLLVPEVTGAAGVRGQSGPEEIRDSGDLDELGALRAACNAAVAALTGARPDLIVVVGGAAATAAYDGSAGGSMRDYGVGYALGDGEPVLPLSLTVGSWLLRGAGADLSRARFQAVARDTPAAACLRLGAEIARSAPRVAVLAMADGPARWAVGSKGAADPDAERYQAEAAAALARADPARLARLAPSLDDELVITGRAAWQVLAGAAEGRRLRGQLRCALTRYEVSYLVASWNVCG
jgi:hypothetical protein